MATCEYLLGYRAALRQLIELAEGEVLELWQTPEGKLFFKKEPRQ